MILEYIASTYFLSTTIKYFRIFKQTKRMINLHNVHTTNQVLMNLFMLKIKLKVITYKCA